MHPSWNESNKPVCGYMGPWVHVGLLVLIFIRIKFLWNGGASTVGTVQLMKCLPQTLCNTVTTQHGWKCRVFSRNCISLGGVAPLTSSHYLAKTAHCSASLDGLFWKMTEEDNCNRCETLAEVQNLNSRVVYGLIRGRPWVRAGHWTLRNQFIHLPMRKLPVATITKYHKLGGLKQQDFFFHSSGGQKCEIQVLWGPTLSQAPWENLSLLPPASSGCHIPWPVAISL